MVSSLEQSNLGALGGPKLHESCQVELDAWSVEAAIMIHAPCRTSPISIGSGDEVYK